MKKSCLLLIFIASFNSFSQLKVDANGKKSTKTWQDAVREANEESKKHKC
jgi:hypothetical protein